MLFRLIKYHIFALLVFGSLISVDKGNCSHADESPKNVLLLNSYHQGMSWVDHVTTGVHDIITPETSDVILFIENMDTKHNPSPDYLRTLRNLYKSKYAEVDFDLILASDNNAYDFLRSYRSELFGEVPVVFCGVNDFHEDQLSGLSKFTGVIEGLSATETVEIALKNHPGTKEIFVINDYLKTGRAAQKEISQQLEPFSSQLKIRYNDNLSLTELENQLARLGKGVVVLLGGYFSDRDGYYVTYEQIGRILAESSHVPIYCLVEFNLGEGVVGGRVVDGLSQGQAMAGIGMRILYGEDADAIPVVKKNVNRSIFNYEELKRFGIDEKLLPGDALITNLPSPVYEVEKEALWTSFVIFTVVFGLMIWLVYLLNRNEKIKKRLEQSESYNRMIFEESPVGIAFCRMNGELLDVNSAYANIVGYSIEELRNISYLDLTPDEYAELETEKLAMLEEEGYFGPYEKDYITRDGGRVPVRASVRLLQKENDEPYILASVEDISKEKLEQARTARMSHLASLGELAAGVAHEINNPINGVINYSQFFLNRFDPPKEEQEILRRIIKEGTRVADIVTNLLNYSRKDSSRLEEVTLLDVVSGTLSLFNNQLMKEGIELSLVAEDYVPTVFGRLSDLERLVMNLVSNSRYALNQKPSAESGPGKMIEIAVQNLRRGKESWARISVEDNGTGIPEEYLEKVFNPFMTTKPAGDGTGLGLSICYQIVQAHNGIIDIESEAGFYTRVTIDLPPFSS